MELPICLIRIASMFGVAFPASRARLRIGCAGAAIADADALLFATPEYNHSVPGALKNAVDWASRPFATAALRNKPAAVIGASTGMFGAVWAQAELRKSLAAAGARVIDRELPIGEADEAFSSDGALAERDQQLALGEILTELLGETRVRATA